MKLGFYEKISGAVGASVLWVVLAAMAALSALLVYDLFVGASAWMMLAGFIAFIAAVLWAVTYFLCRRIDDRIADGFEESGLSSSYREETPLRVAMGVSK